MGEAVKAPGNVFVYHIKTGVRGVWYPASEPMPGGYSLVPTDFPVMKPTTLKGIPGVSANMIETFKNPKNLMLIGGAVAIFLFRKPLIKTLGKTGKSFKKIGHKAGIK